MQRIRAQSLRRRLPVDAVTASILRAVRAGRDITKTEALELCDAIDAAVATAEQHARNYHAACERHNRAEIKREWWQAAALKLIESEEP